MGEQPISLNVTKLVSSPQRNSIQMKDGHQCSARFTKEPVMR